VKGTGFSPYISGSRASSANRMNPQKIHLHGIISVCGTLEIRRLQIM
jgi:hypothetical protein